MGILLKLFIILLAFSQCYAQNLFYCLSITPQTDTILAGDSVRITVMVKDTFGNEYPSYLSTLMWGIPPDSLHDYNISGKADTAILTAKMAYRNVKIGAMVRIGPYDYINYSTITIAPNRSYRVNIEKDSTPINLWHTDSTDTVFITRYDSLIHLFVIERDTFGNYIGMAGNASWVTLRNGIISVSSPSGRKGQADIVAIDSGICPLVVMDSTLVSDTAIIYVTTKPTVCTQFPMGVSRGNASNIRELYDLRGKKLCWLAYYISGAYIVKDGYTYNKRVRVAGSGKLICPR